MASQRGSGWPGLDLIQAADNIDALFPKCSPKQSPSTHNSSFISSLSPPPTSLSSSTNLNKNSPDFNQNKVTTMSNNSQHKLSRTELNISNRMDLSSPTEQREAVDAAYDEIFPMPGRVALGDSREDVYGTSTLNSTSSSGSSSSGLETRRRQDRSTFSSLNRYFFLHVIFIPFKVCVVLLFHFYFFIFTLCCVLFFS